MSKRKQITSYFLPNKKDKILEDHAQPTVLVEPSDEVQHDAGGTTNEHTPQDSIIIDKGIDINSLVRDPGLRKQIDNYDSNERDLIRRAYVDFGPST
ncbi:hypothetical protein HRI_001239700 [Hibiscus trionum]|uniref:Uncharacterized protein n=1 Tax=Hibiscus trionum TaxID=183268 RepID=A0A9W7HDU3_HIBTR|nr:hypothetical protein HRI_001239700 [Hibiscus trionum]